MVTPSFDEPEAQAEIAGQSQEVADSGRRFEGGGVMTLEEMQSLKAGDAVYRIVDISWDMKNAIVRGRGVRLAKGVVSKAPGKSVKSVCIGHYRCTPDNVLTITDGEAAMAAVEVEKRKQEALDQRWAAVRDRLQTTTGEAFGDAFGLRERSSISLVCRDIDRGERIAAAMEIGMAGLRLQGDITALADGGTPVVHLHLSVEQAERVLLALRGTP